MIETGTPGRRRPGRPTTPCEHALPASQCRPCLTARAQRWRKKQRLRGMATDHRQRDPEHRRAARAHAYVRVYLVRGRIVPPARCDVCGSDREPLSFYHPDPPAEHSDRSDPAQRARVQEQLRALLWLCPEHRRTVPASQQPVVPQWTWPGPIDPLPTGTRRAHFACEAAWQEAAQSAIDRHPNANLSTRSIVYMDAFLRPAGLAYRRDLLAAGLRRFRHDPEGFRSWDPFGDDKVALHARVWMRDQLASWNHERHRIVSRPLETDEDRLAERQPLRPTRVARSRTRSRRGTPTTIAAITVPARLPTPARPQLAPEEQREHDEALLARVDAQLAAVDLKLDAIFARIDGAVGPRNKPSRPASPQPRRGGESEP